MEFNPEQLARITRFETMMEEAEALLRVHPCSVAEAERLRTLVRALEVYYTGDDWKRDIADDEAGLLPKDLKRGVLSEDGIYNLLEAFYELTPNSFTIMDDGIPLCAVLERPEAERCPLVIYLHGFTSSKDRPHAVASCEAMREAGFATLRFDLYGHGESGGEFHAHTLFKWVSNTLAVIRYARSLDFVTELWLSGHSQGGLVAALVGGMAPDLIHGMILRAPAFLIPRCAREGSMLGVRFDPAQVPDAIPVIKGLTLDGDYLRVAQMIHVEDAIDRFPGPVLLLHGDADKEIPVEDSVLAARRYQNCRLVVLSGETHHFDQCPNEMKEAIMRFCT